MLRDAPRKPYWIIKSHRSDNLRALVDLSQALAEVEDIFQRRGRPVLYARGPLLSLFLTKNCGESLIMQVREICDAESYFLRTHSTSGSIFIQQLEPMFFRPL